MAKRSQILTKQAVQSRDAILAAALRAFARDGFDGASLPRIAQEAGIAHPLIHYHFGSKDGLWRETVDYAFGGLIREASLVTSVSRDLGPLDRLRVLIRVFTRFAARYPDHFGLIMAEARSDSERLRWLRETYADAFLNRLQDILREAQELGQIRRIPLDHLSFILMGSILLFFSVNFHVPENVDADTLADRHAEYVTQVLLDGIRICAP